MTSSIMRLCLKMSQLNVPEILLSREKVIFENRFKGNGLVISHSKEEIIIKNKN